MVEISLPISKSIANRLLILKAIRGEDLSDFSVDSSTPDDVRLLHSILLQHPINGTIDTRNCGTAMRFLTAYFAQKEGVQIVLDGTERMRERPIADLVTTLRELGADINYINKEGVPPLLIKGKKLLPKQVEIINPLSTQFVSALLLIGVDVTSNSNSPYIEMTRKVISGLSSDYNYLDWSAAAFWYEYVALNGGELLLKGLHKDGLQGDEQVAEIFEALGVKSKFTADGVIIYRPNELIYPTEFNVDFSMYPDLYPAVYICCKELGIPMIFTGLDHLAFKESNRLTAVSQVDGNKAECKHSMADHRIAMALVSAGYKVDDIQCISKSYPQFIEQWQTVSPLS